MKYFTRDYCLGNFSDEEMNRRCKDYFEYIDNIYNKLPFTLKILTKNINLHDGLINKIIFFPQSQELIIKCICGDLSLGYYNLFLKYLYVNNLDKNHLITCFNNKQIEMLYDEIEVFEKDTFLHKIIFNKKGEIEIVFRNLELNITNEISNNYKKNNCILEITV